MSGMFYTLREVADKLHKTEEEVRGIVKAGRLREFRDGPNLLFKVDEVEALMSDTSVMASLKAPGTPAAKPEEKTDEDEILLAPESAENPSPESDFTNADTTAVGGEEIDVLSEADSDYHLTDDTMGETKTTEKSDGTAEASLEKIEEDVNLDTFGSGSGLLDLSLQADDTSLGGILDEIYTSEGKEEKPAGQSAVAPEPQMDDISTETEQIIPEEIVSTSQVSVETPTIVQAVEPATDTLSHAFGIMLFLPMLAIIYTAIIMVASINNVTPAIPGAIQGLIWYVTIAGGIAAILIIGFGFILSSKGSGTGVKKQKTPKTKKAKVAAKEAKEEAA